MPSIKNITEEFDYWQQQEISSIDKTQQKAAQIFNERYSKIAKSWKELKLIELSGLKVKLTKKKKFTLNNKP